jgi:predicted transcriptional regulator
MELKEYLEKNDITPFEFAYELGLSHAAVYHYLSGLRVPRASIVERIIVLTKGKVTWEDFGYETITETKRVRKSPRSQLHKKGKETPG